MTDDSESGCETVVNEMNPVYVGGVTQNDGTTTLAVIGHTAEDVKTGICCLIDFIEHK